jgi:predicted Zn-dependent protease
MARGILSIFTLALFVLPATTWAQNKPVKKKLKPEGKVVWALAQNSATAITKMVQLKSKLKNGDALQAQIKGTSVLLSAGTKGKASLAITLVHPGSAPKGAIKLGAVALVKKPGPAPKALVDEIIGRIKGSKVTLSWSKTVEKPAPAEKKKVEPVSTAAAEEKKQAAANATVEAALRKAYQLMQQGKIEEAKKMLTPIKADHSPEMVLHLAIAWSRLGEKAKATTLASSLKGLAGWTAAAQDMIAGKTLKLGALVEKGSTEAACSLLALMKMARELNRMNDVAELGQAILKKDAKCKAVFSATLLALKMLKKDAEFDALLARALKDASADPHVLQVAAQHYAQAGKHKKAWRLALKMIPLKVPGAYGILMETLVTDRSQLPDLIADMEQAAAKAPKDITFKLMLGALYHRLGQFEKSNTLLAVFRQTHAKEPVSTMFHALNLFNLHKKEEAAAAMKSVEPTHSSSASLYYQRAEVLRDIDRAQAITDLKKYLVFGSRYQNPKSQELRRARLALETLKKCAADKVKTCRGDWLHPRQARARGARPVGAQPTTQAAGATNKTPAAAAKPATKSPDKSNNKVTKKPADKNPKSAAASKKVESEMVPVELIVLAIIVLLGFVVFRRSQTKE